MSYSDLYLRNRKHTFLSVTAAIVLVIFGLFLYFSQPDSFPLTLPSQAVNKNLKVHEVVNLTAHQAGVYWQSTKAEQGWIVYGTSQNELSTVALDERDIGSKKSNFINHYVILKDLKPGTSYHYKIVSGNDVIIGAHNRAFTFKTPTATGQNTTLKPAYGKVLLENGQPAQNVIVILRYKNIVPQVALTKVTGEWLIPLQSVIDKNSHEPVSISETEKAVLEFNSDTDASSSVEALIKNITPLPQSIVLGKEYKFLQEDNVLPAKTSVAEEKKDYSISISLPKENALIPGSRPLLKGFALPGKQVKIQINSQPGYVSRITADAKGEWYVNVPVALSVGSLTMTVTTENASGQQVQLTRKFSIAKNGQQVLGEASPSATIIPSISPTASPSATLALSPTQIATATATITLPLFTATPVSTASPTNLTVSGTPPGFNGSPVLFGGIGLVVVGVGILLAF